MSEFKVNIVAGVAMAIVVALAIAAAVFVLSPSSLQSNAAGTGGNSSSTMSQTSSSVPSNSCSGFAPGGNCLVTYSQDFTISINYSGPWKLFYQAYNSLGKLNPMSVSGSRNGTGFYSQAVTLSSPSNKGLTLCATAQKLDGSDSPLVLKVILSNQTSIPYGSTSVCTSVAP